MKLYNVYEEGSYLPFLFNSDVLRYSRRGACPSCKCIDITQYRRAILALQFIKFINFLSGEQNSSPREDEAEKLF